MSYTITEAVYDCLKKQKINEPFKFIDFYRLCLGTLHLNGNPACPFDGSVQRIMRGFRQDFNLVCIDRNKSVYMRRKEVSA